MPLSGEVIFLRIFDLGGTLDLNRARKSLGDMAALSQVHPSKAAPEYMSFAAPIPINLSSLNLELTDDEGKQASISARLYEVGALAITLRVQIRGETLMDLARYHSAQLYSQEKPVKRQQVSTRVLETLKPLLRSALVDVFDVPVESEPYTTYVLTETPQSAETLFREQRAQIAGLLISEPYPEKLAPSEIEDTLKNWTSYYREDLVAADWDAAFMVEPSGQYEDILYIFEVANLQLLALRKYDLYLDATLDRGYAEYNRLSVGPPVSTGSAREMVRELSEVRMDLAKVTDEVANTAKFFGDWYGARVYMGLAAKLHINDYHKIVEEKLATLNELYQSVLAEIDRRQALALEVTVVVLIVIEVALALFPSFHK
jgi:hypothetical protein